MKRLLIVALGKMVRYVAKVEADRARLQLQLREANRTIETLKASVSERTAAGRKVGNVIPRVPRGRLEVLPVNGNMRLAVNGPLDIACGFCGALRGSPCHAESPDSGKPPVPSLHPHKTRTEDARMLGWTP